MLELINVAKSFSLPGRTDTAVSVLKNVSLRVEAGQSLAIVGPSGSGKSTLLNIIGGLDRATSGQVLHNGKNIGQLDEPSLALMRNKHLGFVFQLHHLLPQCTVLENVLIPTLAVTGGQKAQTHVRGKELLDRVGLTDFVNHRPGELSGGQRQRVAVVRALINKPALLLADEPTGSLDRDAADNIANLLVELNTSEAVSLIVVTHSMDLANRMQRVLRLTDGRIEEGVGA